VATGCHSTLTPEERVRKRIRVRRQLGEVLAEGYVTCGCDTCLDFAHAYKCLYCGEWYCQSCAEAHFGQTRVDYNDGKE